MLTSLQLLWKNSHHLMTTFTLLISTNEIMRNVKNKQLLLEVKSVKYLNNDIILYFLFILSVRCVSWYKYGKIQDLVKVIL